MAAHGLYDIQITQQNVNTGTSTTASCTFSAPAAGDVIVMAVMIPATGVTIGSPGASWTDQGRQTGNGLGVNVFHKVSDGTETSASSTLGSSRSWVASVVVLRGIAASNYVLDDVTSAIASATTHTITSGTVTAVPKGHVLLGIMGIASMGTVTFTADGPGCTRESATDAGTTGSHGMLVQTMIVGGDVARVFRSQCTISSAKTGLARQLLLTCDTDTRVYTVGLGDAADASDRYLDEANTTTDQVSATNVLLGKDATPKSRRPLLKFILTNCAPPAGSYVAEVTLGLYAESVSGTMSTAYLHRILRTLSGLTTWNKYDNSNNWATAGALGTGDSEPGGTYSTGVSFGTPAAGMNQLVDHPVLAWWTDRQAQAAATLALLLVMDANSNATATFTAGGITPSCGNPFLAFRFTRRGPLARTLRGVGR